MNFPLGEEDFLMTEGGEEELDEEDEDLCCNCTLT
jgi:hypothetical protein